jgi:membrane associated rhomboid family serine protease
MRPADSWRKARVTIGLCALIALCWLIASALAMELWAAMWGGFVPARVTIPWDGTTAPVWLTPLTATLVHGGLLHLAFNVGVLAVAGRRVENVLGAAGLAVLFVLGAYAAAGADWLVNPLGAYPLIGASGAVSAIVGAFAILFGRNRLGALRGRIAIWLNALWLLAVWLAVTLMIVIAASGTARGLIGLPLAIIAAVHAAGFLVGAALANPLLRFRWRNA